MGDSCRSCNFCVNYISNVNVLVKVGVIMFCRIMLIFVGISVGLIMVSMGFVCVIEE